MPKRGNARKADEKSWEDSGLKKTEAEEQDTGSEIASFQNRLHQKDVERTKKVIQPAKSTLESGSSSLGMDELRIQRRQEYLERREQQQTELSKRKLQDEKQLFADVVLTKAEYRRMESGEKVLRLASERQLLETQVAKSLQLPSGSLIIFSTTDYKSVVELFKSEKSTEVAEDNSKGEQFFWEDTQIHKSVRKEADTSEGHDLIFDAERIKDIVRRAQSTAHEQVEPRDSERLKCTCTFDMSLTIMKV